MQIDRITVLLLLLSVVFVLGAVFTPAGSLALPNAVLSAMLAGTNEYYVRRYMR